MDERKLKQIKEARYLAADNAWRYRAILHFFFEQHERLRYYLLPQEILNYLRALPYFEEYDGEQLEQDLNQLVTWNNLIPRQDTGKVSSIEEFKKKKFRYQCTPYTVEMERMVRRLEGLSESFGGSLERTHIDKLLSVLQKLLSGEKEYRGEELFGLWEELYDNFRKLTNNAADYLAYLQSEKIEEVMLTEAFLAYKDAITGYLRRFIVALQRNAPRIESLLNSVSRERLHNILEELTSYTLEIPRLEEKRSHEDVLADYLNRWTNLMDWFLGNEEQEGDLFYLQQVTAENIRRITRYVQRLGERHHNLKSRRREYLHLARLFMESRNLRESHRLWAVIFGPGKLAHLQVPPRETEDIYTPLEDLDPVEITVNPRTRYYRERIKPHSILLYQEEKEKAREEFLKTRAEEIKLIKELAAEGRVVLGELGTVDIHVRRTLLLWLTKCLVARDRKTQIASGEYIELYRRSGRRVRIEGNDGVLTLPDYEFIIQK